MFNQDDLYELSTSEEFRAYRREEFRIAARAAREVFLGGDPLEAKGAMDAIRRIINIPLQLAKGEDERIARFRRMVAEDQVAFEAEWIREMLGDE